MIVLTWIHSERWNKKLRHWLDIDDPVGTNTDVSSSTFHPLADPRLRFHPSTQPIEAICPGTIDPINDSDEVALMVKDLSSSQRMAA